ncbi:MAG: OmpH family outer membrane protein [Phycisphaerales bacterium]
MSLNGRSLFVLPLALAMLAGSAALLVRTAALGNERTMAEPIRAAVIDLEMVFAQLESLASEQSRLNELGATIQTEGDRRSAALKAKASDLDVLAPKSDAFMRAQEELLTASIEYETWIKVKQRLVDREKALVLEKIYNDIKIAIREISESDGYDIVFMNDSAKDLISGPEEQVQQQISARRIMYARPSIDISSQVIQRLNNKFKNG